MPINAPNLDDLYILDYGDVLSIQLLGQKDSIRFISAWKRWINKFTRYWKNLPSWLVFR